MAQPWEAALPVDSEPHGSVRMIPVHTDGSSAPPQPNTTRIWGPAPAGNVLVRPKAPPRPWLGAAQAVPKTPKFSGNFQLSLVSCPSMIKDFWSCFLPRSLSQPLLQPFLHPSPLSQGFNDHSPSLKLPGTAGGFIPLHPGRAAFPGWVQLEPLTPPKAPKIP